jgi:hypothetical protein
MGILNLLRRTLIVLIISQGKYICNLSYKIVVLTMMNLESTEAVSKYLLYYIDDISEQNSNRSKKYNTCLILNIESRNR